MLVFQDFLFDLLSSLGDLGGSILCFIAETVKTSGIDSSATADYSPSPLGPSHLSKNSLHHPPGF
jgi:hypothetical protein